MATTSVLSNPKTLLSLPAEIINTIIEYVVHSPSNIELTLSIDNMNLSTLPPQTSWRLGPKQPALAFTCKAMYDDVCSIYFSENTFTWRCDVDDFDSRDLPGKQLQILKTHLGSHARHLQRFFFTMEFLVQYPNKVRRSWYQIRAHISKDGKISCERYCLGSAHCAGVTQAIQIQCCGCDLPGLAARSEERGWNLLELASDFVQTAGYKTVYSICDSCGLQKNRPQ